MPQFSNFDQRRYRTVSSREGYAAWHKTYDESVQDVMDLALLDRISTVSWAQSAEVADLGCGSGRTAAWLASKGITRIDGVDVTPEMLAKARERRLHRRLEQEDARATSLPSAAYDIAFCSLVDEHLAELRELYREARRLVRRDGKFVVVGYHPFFIMATGMPTHFDAADGTQVAIETYVHLPSEHMAAARASGFIASEMLEAVIDDEWVRRKPKWERHRDWPISFAWVWEVAAQDSA